MYQKFYLLDPHHQMWNIINHDLKFEAEKTQLKYAIIQKKNLFFLVKLPFSAAAINCIRLLSWGSPPKAPQPQFPVAIQLGSSPSSSLKNPTNALLSSLSMLFLWNWSALDLKKISLNHNIHSYQFIKIHT